MKTKKYVGKQFAHKTNGDIVLVWNCMHHKKDGERIIVQNETNGDISHLSFKAFKKNYQLIQREHKHIKYAIVDVTEDEVEVQITEQTHRSNEFSKDTNGFFSSDDFELCSIDCPESQKSVYGICYVRGKYTSKDNDTISLSYEDFQRFKKAVAEYNEYFKGD